MLHLEINLKSSTAAEEDGEKDGQEEEYDAAVDVVHCNTPYLCYPGAETGYRVGTPCSRMLDITSPQF